MRAETKTMQNTDARNTTPERTVLTIGPPQDRFGAPSNCRRTTSGAPLASAATHLILHRGGVSHSDIFQFLTLMLFLFCSDTPRFNILRIASAATE